MHFNILALSFSPSIKRYVICFVFLTSLLFTNMVNAIVIRHDIPDIHYQDLAKSYSASVAYLDRCAATVLSEYWLITASHCVSIANKYPIQISHLSLKYPVEKIVLPPETAQFSDTDLALLKLKWPLHDSVPVRVYRHKDELGKKVVIVGKGLSGNGLTGEIIDDDIERAASNIITSVDKNWINFSFEEPTSSTELEGVSGTEDSGGPAFLMTKNGLYLVGVSCCQTPTKTQDGSERQGGYLSTEHYSRISPHWKWIESLVNQKFKITHINSPILQALSLKKYSLAKQLMTDNHDWLNNPELISEILTFTFFRSNELSFYLLNTFKQLHNHKIRGLPLTVYAYLQGNSAVFSLLIKLGVAMDYTGFSGQQFPSLITWQYFNDDYDHQLALLLDKGFDLNAPDERGNTALHMAVYLGRSNRVKTLLDSGADIDKINAKGNSALIEATLNRNIEVVKVLIKRGADKSIFNYKNKNAYSLAVELGDKNLLKILAKDS